MFLGIARNLIFENFRDIPLCPCGIARKLSRFYHIVPDRQRYVQFRKSMKRAKSLHPIAHILSLLPLVAKRRHKETLFSAARTLKNCLAELQLSCESILICQAGRSGLILP